MKVFNDDQLTFPGRYWNLFPNKRCRDCWIGHIPLPHSQNHLRLLTTSQPSKLPKALENLGGEHRKEKDLRQAHRTFQGDDTNSFTTWLHLFEQKNDLVGVAIVVAAPEPGNRRVLGKCHPQCLFRWRWHHPQGRVLLHVRRLRLGMSHRNPSPCERCVPWMGNLTWAR